MERSEGERPHIQIPTPTEIDEGAPHRFLEVGHVRREVAHQESAQRLELDEGIGLVRAQQQGRGLGAIPGPELVDLALHEGSVGPELPPPARSLTLELGYRAVTMALGAGSDDAQLGIEARPRNRDGVVGSGERDLGPDLRVLEIGHVTGHATAPGRRGRMVRMSLRVDELRRVTRGALAVVEWAGERPTVRVPVSLAVGLVTAHAIHRPVEVAGAGQMIGLVAEGADSSVREVGLVTQHRKLEGVEGLQRFPGQIPLLDDVFEGMAAEANRQRCVFPEVGEALHPHIDCGPIRTGPLDMTSTGPVTRLAVDL